MQRRERASATREKARASSSSSCSSTRSSEHLLEGFGIIGSSSSTRLDRAIEPCNVEKERVPPAKKRALLPPPPARAQSRLSPSASSRQKHCRRSSTKLSLVACVMRQEKEMRGDTDAENEEEREGKEGVRACLVRARLLRRGRVCRVGGSARDAEERKGRKKGCEGPTRSRRRARSLGRLAHRLARRLDGRLGACVSGHVGASATCGAQPDARRVGACARRRRGGRAAERPAEADADEVAREELAEACARGRASSGSRSREAEEARAEEGDGREREKRATHRA